MSISIQCQFNSAVVEANKDVFTRSYIEGKNTIIEFDLRKRDYQKEFKINTTIFWPAESYTVDAHEFSTFHNPIIYRFILAQGYYYNNENKRVYFTPKISEISTMHHVSKNVIRLSCFLSVICGVTLRNIALILTHLFLIPISKSSIKRWIDEIGQNLPGEEDILKQLIALKEPTECHIDAYYPLGTTNCVMVIKDEFDRILITYETKTENGEDAKKFLQKIKELGIDIKSGFSDYSKSFTEAIREVFPKAKLQADHFHTAKNIWKHLKKGFFEYRKQIKEEGEREKNEELIELARKLWELRWTLLKKPCNLTPEERLEIESIEKIDGGFIFKFRSIIRQIVTIFDYSNTELQAEIRLKKLKEQIDEIDNKHFDKIVKFFKDHWDLAMQYLRKRGLAKYRRSSNSESGMRILRRLEKNHDGIRSEVTRKHYIKIYQAIKYLSVDISDFINNGIVPLNKGDT